MWINLKRRLLKRFKNESQLESNKNFTFASPRPQNFSLPNSIIYYIKNNPQNPEGYKKLIKTCKYFKPKNPIHFISTLVYWPKDFGDDSHFGHICADNCMMSRIGYLDINAIKYQIWLTFKLQVYQNDIIPSLISKLYRCDVKQLFLHKQNLTHREFIILTSSGTIEFMSIDRTIVEYENEKIMPLEEIIKCLPKLKEFYLIGELAVAISITSESAENLLKIPHLANIETFSIEGIPEVFDFETFLNNAKMKGAGYGGFKGYGGYGVSFHFCDSISENYKQRLQAYVNKILEIGLTENDPPKLIFPGQEPETATALSDLKREYRKRIEDREAQKLKDEYRRKHPLKCFINRNTKPLQAFVNYLQKLKRGGRPDFSMYT